MYNPLHFVPTFTGILTHRGCMKYYKNNKLWWIICHNNTIIMDQRYCIHIVKVFVLFNTIKYKRFYWFILPSTVQSLIYSIYTFWVWFQVRLQKQCKITHQDTLSFLNNCGNEALTWSAYLLYFLIPIRYTNSRTQHSRMKVKEQGYRTKELLNLQQDIANLNQ